MCIRDREVTVAAAEVQHDQVGIGGQSSLAGGVVGDDDVARTAVQGYQHGGGRVPGMGGGGPAQPEILPCDGQRLDVYKRQGLHAGAYR